MAQRPMADLPIELSDQRLSVVIETPIPLKVDEVTSIIGSIRDEYFRYVVFDRNDKGLVERSLFVSELRTGSLIVEFAIAAAGLAASVPSLAQQNTFIDYIHNLKSGYEYLISFGKGNTPRRKSFSDKQAENLREVAAPITEGVRRGIKFRALYESKRKTPFTTEETRFSFELDPESASHAVNGADKHLNAKPRRGEVFLQDVELRFDRTIAQPAKSKSKASHKTIIEDESARPVSTILASEINKQRIVGWWENENFNPFTARFRADVIAKYNDKGEPISYTILSIKRSD